jgi:hypothetical protein
MNVALEPGTPLLVHRDLDNYLTPLMSRMRSREVVSAWGTKFHGDVSSVQLETARLDMDPTTGWGFAHARASGSATSSAWKQAIYDQIAEQAEEAAAGALEMQVSFRVGLERTWINLWKQSIDALGPILGMEDPRHPFNPLDGRIVRLGVHHTLAPELGYDVELGVWWRPAVGFEAEKMPTRRKPATQEPASLPRPALRRTGTDCDPVEFRNDDAGYINWINAHVDGFVVNTTPGHSRTYLKLHRASCKFVSVLQSGYSTWTAGQYIKVCSNDRSTLESWARDEVGGQLQDRCYCRP